MAKLTESINEIIGFLTDPGGIGFPILIGAGLGIILYLMNFTSKEWKKSDMHIEEGRDTRTKTGFPQKPF